MEEVVPQGFVKNLFDLTGKTAVVTGAGSGLGAAIAMGFAQAGMNVALLDVNDEGLEKTASAITSQGGNSAVYHCDVTSSKELNET